MLSLALSKYIAYRTMAEHALMHGTYVMLYMFVYKYIAAHLKYALFGGRVCLLIRIVYTNGIDQLSLHIHCSMLLAILVLLKE